jgi:hypothetical protein
MSAKNPPRHDGKPYVCPIAPRAGLSRQDHRQALPSRQFNHEAP